MPGRSGQQGRTRARRRVRWARVVLLAFAAFILVSAAGVAEIVAKAFATMPVIGNPMARTSQASVIYAQVNGQWQPVTIVPGAIPRQTVDVSQVPPVVQDAFVAVEDKNFYTNTGIDFKSMARAALNDLEGHPLQGASTITEQLARNLYLSQARTLTRKVQEAWLGMELARMYTKPQILGMYLNIIYLGAGTYGVETASETYFGTSVQNLTLPQAALLAGLPQDPNGYNPFLHPNAARTRRNVVLAVMAKLGYITAAQAKAAEAAPLGLSSSPPPSAPAGYPDAWFVDEVLSQLENTYHLSQQVIANGGLKIYTTLDPTIQQAAQQYVDNLPSMPQPCQPGASCQAPGIWSLSQPASNILQLGLVVMNQYNGNVVAVIGGRQHTGEFDFNRAIQSTHLQPGSSIKPIVDYIPALEAGMTAGTTVDDAVEAYDVNPGQPNYIPHDYQLPYYGLTTFDEALRRSVNTVAVKVLNKIGVQTGFNIAVKMGLPLTAADDHLSVALGGTTDCCSPLDMATAYSTIANGGSRVTPRFIEQVVSPDGQVLISNPPQVTPNVISPQVAYVMTKMLETVDEPQPNVGWDITSGAYDSNWGTGYDGQIHDNVSGWPSAAKTGTSQNDDALWYVGYTPLYTAAVWVGYDQPKPVAGGEGGSYAGPIWKAVMTAAVAGQKVVHFTEPTGVVQAPIDIKAPAWSVAMPGPLTPPQDIREEWFVQGTQPTTINPLWKQLAVDSANPSLLWGQGCPAAPEMKLFLNRPPLDLAWANTVASALNVYPASQFIPLDMDLAPPTQYCGQKPSNGFSTILPGTGSSSASSTSVSSTTSSSTGTGSSSASDTSGSSTVCQPAWAISVQAGKLTPKAICVPYGDAVTLTLHATDGRAHVLILAGYGQRVNVPASGAPVVLSFRAGLGGTFLLQDTSDPAVATQITVAGAP